MNWEIAEQYGCRFFKSQRTPGSGNGNIKGDLRQTTTQGRITISQPDGWRTEVKFTEKEYITFQYSWLIKITKEAFSAQQNPAFYIVLGDGTRLALIPSYEPYTGSYIQLSDKSTRLRKEDFIGALKSPQNSLFSALSKREQILYWLVCFDDSFKTIDDYSII